VTGRVLVVSIAITGLALMVSAQDRTEDNAAEQNFLSNNRVVAGAELYRMYCATCHGVDGRGEGPVADAMKHQLPDLTTINKRNGGRFPALRVEHIIDGYDVKAAHGSRAMPVWGEFFHDMRRDEVLLKLREHNLVEYIRSIQK
jgi:mono/diheme cytochrome c family protein